MNHEDDIRAIAARNALDPLLVMAQVTVESGGNAWAFKPEPLYGYLWNVRTNKPFRQLVGMERQQEFAPDDFPFLAGSRDQEWIAQQASWGLMQIMGAVAREQGFRGLYLTELTDPIVNLSIGCKVLASLLVWAKGNVEQALAAYNGGKGGNTAAPFRNKAYAAKVFAARTSLKE